MLRVMVPGRIKKGQGFQTHVSKWEGWVNKLERDHKEKTSDMAKLGILIGKGKRNTFFADTVGSADMMLRGVGRVTPTSFRGNPPMLSKKIYNYLIGRSDNSGRSVCGLECDAGAWQTVVRKRRKASKNFMETPPGLKDDNRFDKLSETYDVGGLEVLMPDESDWKSWDDGDIEICQSHDRFWSS